MKFFCSKQQAPQALEARLMLQISVLNRATKKEWIVFAVVEAVPKF
jgi:hypothetical protein